MSRGGDWWYDNDGHLVGQGPVRTDAVKASHVDELAEVVMRALRLSPARVPTSRGNNWVASDAFEALEELCSLALTHRDGSQTVDSNPLKHQPEPVPPDRKGGR